MDAELPAVLVANQRYRDSVPPTPGRPAAPARRLVILTCMDARLDPFAALGLELGDAHVLRNAGGRASDDAIRSLVVSTHVLGTREVGVIHHTKCGMEGTTDAELGDRTGVHGMAFLPFQELEASVVDDVGVVRAAPLADGTVVWGGVYDVDTGELRIVVPAG